MSEDTIERLERLLNRTVDKLGEFHEEFATFRAEMRLLVNGGPGKSAECGNHMAELAKVKQRVYKMEKQFYIWSGALTVLVFGVTIFAPTIRAFITGHP